MDYDWLEPDHPLVPNCPIWSTIESSIPRDENEKLMPLPGIDTLP
jgi:hypothetical protein